MCPRSSRAPARWLRSVLGALTLAAALAVAGCGGDDGAPLDRDARLARDLRAGGLVLVMRHAMTDTAVEMQEVLGDCGRQRNLSLAGREQAKRVGDAIRAAGIPVGEVRASPMCRTKETAELAFPGDVVVDRRLVTAGVVGTEAADRRRIRALERLATRKPADGNLVLVTHTGNIGGAFGEETVNEGDVVVLRPRPEGAQVLRVVRPDQWAALVARD